jgi:hypothetical protein
VIRVELPFHLQTLARVGPVVSVYPDGPVTLAAVLDALESAYPMLRGTIRDHTTRKRRPLIRFIACQQDLSHIPHDTLLPEAVRDGVEPVTIIGAIAGG